MNLTYQNNCNDIPWDEVPVLLKKVEMSHAEPGVHRIAFEQSREVVFVFDAKKLVGLGRCLSDGVRQAALYDIAVDPAYQGKGIGKEIVARLMQELPGCNFILYASPGKEDFYRCLNFKKMKTGMVFFANPDRMDDPEFIEG